MKKLIEQAIKASQNAYAPYSKFRVGAALLASSGKIYSGCNIENASYGLTVCAERNAVANAVLNGEKIFQKIAVYVNSYENFPPCGACRQVLSEFSNDLEIILINKNLKPNITNLNKLLPNNFKLKK